MRINSFITVTSKSGNTFYIIIDRAADGKNTVHFLNQVDEADLLALTEGKEPQTQPAVCTCAEKCEASSVKMDCEVCKNDRSGCVGKEPAAEEPKEEPKEKGGLIPALIPPAPASDRRRRCVLLLQVHKG